MAILLMVLPLLPALAPSSQDYAYARNVRLNLGHEAAVLLYQKLLKENPKDITAATRIAACRDTPSRHDDACRYYYDPIKIQQLRNLLRESNYDNQHIQSMFGITENHKLTFAAGPVYLTPATASSVTDPIQVSFSESKEDRSLQCLVSLFLLGLSGTCR